MQKSEAKTLEALDSKDPLEIAGTLLSRVQKIQQTNNQIDSSVGFETVATILLLSDVRDQLLRNQSQSSDDSVVSQAISGLCYQDSFRSAMHRGPYRKIARNLVGKWILKADETYAVQAMYFSMENELPEGLTVARKFIRNEETRKDLAQFAVQTIAKMGDSSDLPILNKMLDDQTTLYQNKVRTTQMRDVVLAAMIHLSKQKYEHFGLNDIRLSETLVFGVSSVGFLEDKVRDANLEKWRAYYQSDKAEKADLVSDAHSSTDAG